MDSAISDLRGLTKKEEIIKKLTLIDEEKSLLLSGNKFVVYQGFGSQLLHALINFMRAENNKRGYYLFDTPYLVNVHNLYNTGQFHKFQDNLYKILFKLLTVSNKIISFYHNFILFCVLINNEKFALNFPD